jgi:uncharacterized damage-inducible protein DinB
MDQALYRISESTERVKACLELISEEELWLRPTPVSNSIGNLILHLAGNMRQYIVSSLGRRPDQRQRDSEFSAEGGFTKEELLTYFLTNYEEVVAVLRSLTDQDLLESKSVQVYNLSGIGHILHVVEHYSYHAGQIAFWTKQLRNQDLGFYKGIPLA